MDEDSAGDKFCEEDIDQILERRTQIITLESEKGSTFSKASFASSGIRSDIDIDDPDFWKKWAKKAEIDTVEESDKVSGNSSHPVTPVGEDCVTQCYQKRPLSRKQCKGSEYFHKIANMTFLCSDICLLFLTCRLPFLFLIPLFSLSYDAVDLEDLSIFLPLFYAWQWYNKHSSSSQFIVMTRWPRRCYLHVC